MNHKNLASHQQLMPDKFEYSHTCLLDKVWILKGEVAC